MTSPAKTVSFVKDPSGAPAVDLAKVREQHPDLAKRADKAGISLSKRNLAGVRAQACLYLDHSGSMRTDYRSGAVQTIVERALGFALQIDADGTVPVTPFDSRLWDTVNVTVDNYQGVVDRELWHRSAMGGTRMAPPFQHLLDEAKRTQLPLFAIVVGDGSPADSTPTTKLVIELANYPVFIKFLSVRPVDYLQELDELEQKSGRSLIGRSTRKVDNVDAQDMPDPAGLPDLAFAEKMVEEWDTWFAAATAAGILSA
ncbi:VWA domain-containing protein (plasmid) [Pseudonocardia sp. DSM 110487]|uniref:VWA domain-containing protein n=1 Tax=Pseudonocardia sp. DSM 110487 TaxID=2865833 RepID=UPI001C6991DD|nr:VWA domain-containing protein [Pseudonocardia sp. DSM 110487]QYN41172.1 VWA domain-containing protein [Pseudonocardia sp. DSM 110487]